MCPARVRTTTAPTATRRCPKSGGFWPKGRIRGRTWYEELHLQRRSSGQGSGANVPFGCYQTLGSLRLKFSPNPTGARLEREFRPARRNTCGRSIWGRRPRTLSMWRMACASNERISSAHPTRCSSPSSPPTGQGRCHSRLPWIVRNDSTHAPNDHELLMTGTLNDGAGQRCQLRGTSARVAKSVLSGQRQTNSSSKRERVLLVFTAATDFRGFAGRQLIDPVGTTLTDLDKASKKSFARLRAAQQAIMRSGSIAFRSTSMTRASPNSALPMANDSWASRKAQ